MRFSVAAALAVLPALVAAQNQTIMVGSNGGLTFDPPSVNASVGDTLTFMFMAKNHTLTQSSFASPCTNVSANPIDSGFQNVVNGSATVPSFSFTVNDTSAPLWFYCRQTGHCAKGMVFAVNPTAAKSFSAFQTAANATASNTTSTSASAGSSSTGSPSSSASGSTPSSGAVGLAAPAGVVLAGLGLVAGLIL